MRQSGQLLNVQIMRAIAAALVVFGHAGQEMSLMAAKTGQSAPNLEFFNWAWGVDIFFVISGFIMMHTSSEHFGKPGASREFIRRRLIRIVPLYWLTTTAFVLTALLAPKILNVPPSSLWHGIASYAFIPEANANGAVRPLLALGWTLNYEMFFYVLFALGMLLPLRKGLMTLCAIFVTLLSFGALGPWHNTQVDFWTSQLLAEFLLGVGIGLMARRGFALNGLEALLLCAAGVAGAIIMGPLWAMEADIPELARAGVPAAFLVTAAVLGPDVSRNKVTVWLAFVGDASFALYLIHPFAIRPLREIWLRVADGYLPMPLYLLAAVASAIAVAALVHLYVERPMTRALNAFGRAGAQPKTTGRTGALAPV